jgi:hypothetical protein
MNLICFVFVQGLPKEAHIVVFSKVFMENYLLFHQLEDSGLEFS